MAALPPRPRRRGAGRRHRAARSRSAGARATRSCSTTASAFPWRGSSSRTSTRSTRSSSSSARRSSPAISPRSSSAGATTPCRCSASTSRSTRRSAGRRPSCDDGRRAVLRRLDVRVARRPRRQRVRLPARDRRRASPASSRCIPRSSSRASARRARRPASASRSLRTSCARAAHEAWEELKDGYAGLRLDRWREYSPPASSPSRSSAATSRARSTSSGVMPSMKHGDWNHGEMTQDQLGIYRPFHEYGPTARPSRTSTSAVLDTSRRVDRRRLRLQRRRRDRVGSGNRRVVAGNRRGRLTAVELVPQVELDEAASRRAPAAFPAWRGHRVRGPRGARASLGTRPAPRGGARVVGARARRLAGDGLRARPGAARPRVTTPPCGPSRTSCARRSV